MIEAGEIGEVRHVQASYLQSWLTGRHWGDWRTEERWLWRLSSAHGSKGVLGDIGVHILDFVTYGTGLDIVGLSARMKTFDKAEGGVIDVYTLDVNDSVAMTVEFSNGALGVVHMSRFATGKPNDLDLLIHGDKGALKVWANSTSTPPSRPASAPTSTPRPGPPIPARRPRATRSASSSRSSPAQNGEPDFRHADEGAEAPRPHLHRRRRGPDAAGRLTYPSSHSARYSTAIPAKTAPITLRIAAPTASAASAASIRAGSGCPSVAAGQTTSGATSAGITATGT